jgi:hypothetical protein
MPTTYKSSMPRDGDDLEDAAPRPRRREHIDAIDATAGIKAAVVAVRSAQDASMRLYRMPVVGACRGPRSGPPPVSVRKRPTNDGPEPPTLRNPNPAHYVKLSTLLPRRDEHLARFEACAAFVNTDWCTPRMRLP